MSNKTRLEVGDEIAGITFREGVNSFYKVERVTATMAMSKGYKFRRDIDSDGAIRVVGPSSCFSRLYQLATPAHHAEAKWKRGVQTLSLTAWEKLPRAVVEQIVALVNEHKGKTE